LPWASNVPVNIAGKPLAYNVLLIMSISYLFLPVIPFAINNLQASSNLLVKSKSGAITFSLNNFC